MRMGWRPPSTHSRAELMTLCFVLCNSDLLVLRRRYPPYQGRWNCPGGKIEAGESPAEACVREVYEETGLQVLDPQLRGVITVPTKKKGINTNVFFLFVVHKFTGEIRNSNEGFVDWLPVKYISDEPLIAPDLPILYEHFVQTTGVMTAKIAPSIADADGLRIICDYPALGD